MELRACYKASALGPIPEDWNVCSLGDLGTIVRGASPRPAGDPRYFNGGYIPWLTVASLTTVADSQLSVYETATSLTEEGAQYSRTLPPDTLVIANSGATLGVAKILRISCCANDGVAALIGQKVGDKEFLCYYINSQTTKLREVVAAGNGQPNLNTALIRSIRVPFPPLVEQRAIAAAIGECDSLLIALEHLIAKKRDVKQAVTQKLLTGECRMPGFRGPWTTTVLADVADVLKGHGLAKSDVMPSATRPCILYGELFTAYGRIITEVISRTDSPDGRPSVAGDVLVPGSTTTTGVDLATASALLTGGVAVGGDINIIRARHRGYDPVFLAYYLTALKRREIAERAQGTTIVHLYGRDLLGLPLSLPSLEEQMAIASTLSDMDAELTALEQRLTKTGVLKQAMMQELLTGRTRLV